jgi:hypothetical protein
MGMIFWLAAVIVAIFGILRLLAGDILWGVILLVVAAAIGPGGWSVFGRRSA